jgi:hypothetical protein
MSEWITDRLPTEKDVEKYPELAGNVWAMKDGEVTATYWKEVPEGIAWMPLFKPYKYVKPKRYSLECDKGFWRLRDKKHCDMERTIHFGMPFFGDDKRDAAQRICDIYNEVDP